jgi:hypothetical protein
MLTINAAKKDLPHGPATYLLDETHGRSIRPYPWTGATKPSDAERLKGKDCGSYGGFLHTDHAVRTEFFEPHDVPPTKEQPYLMDFTYIFDDKTADNKLFMEGEVVKEEDVTAELGGPEDMRFIAADKQELAPTPPPAGAVTRIEEIMGICKAWRLSDAALEDML